MHAAILALILALTPLAAAAQMAETFEDGRIAAEAGQYDRARDIWNRLAAAGDAEAQNALGYIYQKGLGVLRNSERALALYTAAAEQGHANAANNLGIMYTQGQGAARDYVRAYCWYSLAAIQGDEAADRNRSIVARGMSYDDMSAASALLEDTIARLAGRLQAEEALLLRERAERYLSPGEDAAAQNAGLAIVPRTRRPGAPQGLVGVPQEGRLE